MNKPVITIFAIILTITFNIGTLSLAHAATADALIDLANSSRTENGLADLTENSRLTSAAYAKANDMLSNDYFAHTSPSGKTPWDFIKAVGYDYTYAGENLAIGYNADKELHDAWMDSPTHRANILNGNFHEIGIAVVNGEYEGAETTVVVQMFGTPAPVKVAAPVVTPNNVPQIESAQTLANTETTPVSAGVFSLNQEKTGFSPSQIFGGERIKFIVVLTGEAKTILVDVANQKIDLLEASTIERDGETKTYTKEVELNTVGEWPVTLTATNDAGQVQTMNMGNLKIAQKTLEKPSNNSIGATIGGFMAQYRIILITILGLALMSTGVFIYRNSAKKPSFKF